jgi:sugar transferase (PEP-CTERM/EpsH1 system associated)
VKVLFLTPQLPWPLDQGARIRNYHLLRAMAAEHTVDLLSLDAGGEDNEETPSRQPSPIERSGEAPCADGGLRQLCRRVQVFPAPRRGRAARLRTLVRSALPDLAHRAWLPALAARVRTLTAGERYDVVQISSLEMMPYRRAVATRDGAGPAVVFDNLNVEYQLQRRACLTDLREPRRLHAAAYSAVQWRRLRHYEARLCREAAAVVAVSDTDAALLRRLAPEGRFLVLPNGVDTAAFAFRPPVDGDAAGPDTAPTLLFTGTMDFRPNVDAVLWLAEAILPRLRRARPDLRCLVVGKSPDPRLLAAARRQPGLVVTGAVPDVRPYLARAAVYVVPMRMGSGVRLKVLEAMAAGVPVVSTPMGLEGIAATPGEHAAVAETPEAFAGAVLRLLDDPAQRARQARQARALVEAGYDWDRLAPALPALYTELRATRA